MENFNFRMTILSLLLFMIVESMVPECYRKCQTDFDHCLSQVPTPIHRCFALRDLCRSSCP